MESTTGFNLQRQIAIWANRIKSEPAVTEADAEELKSHLLDLIDDLKASGLDEEEAYLIASRRLGDDQVWSEEYRQGNNPVIQMRRSLIILAGVLAYFLCYYFILSTSKLLLISMLFKDVNGQLAVEWVFRYLIIWHFLVLLFLVSIFFLEKKAIAFIEKIQLKPRHSMILLLTTIFFALADTCLFPIAKGMMGANIPLKSHLYHHYLNFDFSFPLMISLGFIFIYYRYYKKAKI
jgi:hypothetical protein